MADVSKTNDGSFKGRRKAITLNGRLVGCIRDVTVKLAKRRRASMRNAHMRIVQPNPTSGMRWTTIIGKITPPKEEPAATRPKAAPLLWKNQVETWDSVSQAHQETRVYAIHR